MLMAGKFLQLIALQGVKVSNAMCNMKQVDVRGLKYLLNSLSIRQARFGHLFLSALV